MTTMTHGVSDDAAGFSPLDAVLLLGVGPANASFSPTFRSSIVGVGAMAGVDEGK